MTELGRTGSSGSSSRRKKNNQESSLENDAKAVGARRIAEPTLIGPPDGKEVHKDPSAACEFLT